MAAQKAHTLKKKVLREGILSILPLPTQNLFQELQDNGSIGEHELHSACLTWLAKLAGYQQSQVGQPYNLCLRPQQHCLRHMCSDVGIVFAVLMSSTVNTDLPGISDGDLFLGKATLYHAQCCVELGVLSTAT